MGELAQWVGNDWVGNDWVGNNWVGNNWVGNNWVGSSWYGAEDERALRPHRARIGVLRGLGVTAASGSAPGCQPGAGAAGAPAPVRRRDGRTGRRVAGRGGGSCVVGVLGAARAARRAAAGCPAPRRPGWAEQVGRCCSCCCWPAS